MANEDKTLKIVNDSILSQLSSLTSIDRKDLDYILSLCTDICVSPISISMSNTINMDIPPYGSLFINIQEGTYKFSMSKEFKIKITNAILYGKDPLVSKLELSARTKLKNLVLNKLNGDNNG